MEISLSEFKLIKEIGQGGFGVVHLAERKAEQYAIKSLKISSELPEGVLVEIKHEIKIMLNLRHPNIVLLIAFSMEEQPQRYMAMEYMEGGNLRSLLSSNTPIPPTTQRQFALDIARGLNYLHTLPKPVFHRDMKANNVLIDRHGTLKVADFGLSTVSIHSRPATAIQPMNWCAPELAQEKPFTCACDMYSYGMTLYEILSRQLPFQGKTAQQIFIALMNNTRPEIPLNCPDDLVDLMVVCWQTKPSARPTFEMVVTQLRSSIQESDPAKAGEASKSPAVIKQTIMASFDPFKSVRIKPKDKKKTKKKISKSDILAPDTNKFEHVAHLGYDQEKGFFDSRGIPEEWMQHTAGIIQALKDKETAADKDKETAALMKIERFRNPEIAGPSGKVPGAPFWAPPPSPPPIGVRAPPPSSSGRSGLLTSIQGASIESLRKTDAEDRRGSEKQNGVQE